jgi:arabinose-5-phosphate isomerase
LEIPLNLLLAQMKRLKKNETTTFAHLTAKDIMTKNPKVTSSEVLVVEALNTMEQFSITQLVVVDNGEYKGVLHLHDILKEGIL